MNIFLSYRQIPEFRDLPRHDALRRYRICYLRSFLYWENWLGLLFLFLCIVGHDWLVRAILPPNSNFVTVVIEYSVLIVLGFISALVYIILVNHRIRLIYQNDHIVLANKALDKHSV
jgi:hypothetical protein